MRDIHDLDTNSRRSASEQSTEATSQSDANSHEFNALSAFAGAFLKWAWLACQRSSAVTFAVRAIEKLAAFLVIASCALLIRTIVAILERHGVPLTATFPLVLIEYLLLFADLAWFICAVIEEVCERLSDLHLEKSPKKAIIGGCLLALAMGATVGAAMSSSAPTPTLKNRSIRVGQIALPVFRPDQKNDRILAHGDKSGHPRVHNVSFPKSAGHRGAHSCRLLRPQTQLFAHPGHGGSLHPPSREPSDGVSVQPALAADR